MEVNQKGKIKLFLKKYAYFFITFLCVALIALVVALTANTNIELGGGTADVNAGAITFTLPVANATVDKEFSADSLLYNITLERWMAHKAIDLKAVKGADVLSAYDGVIKSIYTNTLEGTVVVIKHSDSLETRYGSLDSKTLVEVGDIVKKGDVIAKASDTASTEAAQGAHVHFEVWKDGTKVDPTGYLNLEGK